MIAAATVFVSLGAAFLALALVLGGVGLLYASIVASVAAIATVSVAAWRRVTAGPATP